MSVIAMSGREVLLQAQSPAWTDIEEDFSSSKSWTEGLIQSLQLEYEAIHSSVFRHLQRNPDLAWILLVAKEHLEEAFGPSAVVRVQLVTDPDLEEKQEQLFGYIRSWGAQDRATALAQFDRWFVEQLPIVGGRLVFDLDF